MSGRDVTFADKISLLEIKNQPPNTSRCQMTEITGVSESTIAHIIQQQEKVWDEWKLHHRQRETSQKSKCEGWQ
jgi:hypothetical protein